MPEPDLAALIAELERLNEGATQLEWTYDNSLCEVIVTDKDGDELTICKVCDLDPDWGIGSFDGNGQFIAGIHNALPAILAALKQAATVQAQRNELAKALEQIEQMGHYPADLAPDLIGDPERDSKLCDRLADVANHALARIVGNVT